MSATGVEEKVLNAAAQIPAEEAIPIFPSLIVDEQSVALDLLSLLPDANQEPLGQRINSFDTFTCFKDLPFELRTQIWKRAFPGPRKVNLRTREQFWFATRRDAVRFRKLPSLLWVNQECCKLMLETYSFVDSYTIIDPSRDMAYVSWLPLMFDEEWVPAIFNNHAFIHRIQSLQIREITWSQHQLYGDDNQTYRGFHGPFKYSTGLKKRNLRLVAPQSRWKRGFNTGVWRGVNHQDEEELFVKCLQRLFIKYAKLDHARTLPKISLHQRDRVGGVREAEFEDSEFKRQWDYTKEDLEEVELTRLGNNDGDQKK